MLRSCKRLSPVPLFTKRGILCFFVDPQNQHDIAQALKDFASNSKQTIEMGKTARNLFETHYNWEKEAEQLHQFYLNL